MTTAAALKKSLAAYEKRFGGLRKLGEADPLDQIVLLILARGSGEKKAQQALEGLRSRFVDWNEIRVSERYEIEEAISALGKRGMQGKADAIRDLLAAVYGRFNRTSLAFLLEANDKSTTRAREKLVRYLAEISPAIALMMECYFAKKPLIVRSPVPRIMVDEKLAAKGATTATVRKQLESGLSEEEQTLFVWAMLGLHEEAEAARQAERDRKEREKLDAKRRIEDAKRKKVEEAERKKREAEIARQRKSAEKIALRKIAEARKKAEAKKAEAKKKTEAKKSTAKKAAAKKTSAKKASTKKAAAKKTTAKKAVTKKTAAKKAPAKKVAKKAAAKKAPAKKVTKKAAAKKAPAKKAAAKKTTKKAAAKKATKKTSKKASKKTPASRKRR